MKTTLEQINEISCALIQAMPRRYFKTDKQHCIGIKSIGARINTLKLYEDAEDIFMRNQEEVQEMEKRKAKTFSSQMSIEIQKRLKSQK